MQTHNTECMDELVHAMSRCWIDGPGTAGHSRQASRERTGWLSSGFHNNPSRTISPVTFRSLPPGSPPPRLLTFSHSGPLGTHVQSLTPLHAESLPFNVETNSQDYTRFKVQIRKCEGPVNYSKSSSPGRLRCLWKRRKDVTVE